jgi:hypothetical protein
MLFRVDRNEFENTVLRNDAHDSFSPCLVIDIHQRYTPGTALKHAITGFVQWSRWMHGDCFEGLNTDGLFDFCVLPSAIVLAPGF